MENLSKLKVTWKSGTPDNAVITVDGKPVFADNVVINIDGINGATAIITVYDIDLEFEGDAVVYSKKMASRPHPVGSE